MHIKKHAVLQMVTRSVSLLKRWGVKKKKKTEAEAEGGDGKYLLHRYLSIPVISVKEKDR